MAAANSLLLCLFGLVFVARALPTMPGEMLFQLSMESNETPRAMEGDEYTPASHQDMNATPKHDAAAVVTADTVEVSKQAQHTVDDVPQGAVVTQLLELFATVSKPFSDEEMNAVSDVVSDVAKQIPSNPVSKDLAIGAQTLLQTDADPLTDMLSVFASMIDHPMTSDDKHVLGDLVSKFTTLGKAILSKSTQSQEPVSLLEVFSTTDKATQNKMIETTLSAMDSTMGMNTHGFQMPETTPNGADANAMEPPTTTKHAPRDIEQADQSMSASAFNMNTQTSSMTHQMNFQAGIKLTASANDGMNGPLMQSENSMVSPVVEEKPHVDDMQLATLPAQKNSNEPFDLLDDKQGDEHDMSGGMPEANLQDTVSLAAQMESNVKITQIPDHTGL